MTEFAIKMAGMLFIAVSAVLTGNYIILGYKKRIRELEALKKAMVMFKNEIAYSASTLEECFRNISIRCSDEQIAGLFDSAAQKLSDSASNRKSAKVIWEDCIREERVNMHLNEEDITELAALGAGLGYLDAKMQTEAIELYLSISETALKNAVNEIGNKCKVTRALSMACGALICILLI